MESHVREYIADIAKGAPGGPEVQKVLPYLVAKAGVDEGVLEQIWQQVAPGGVRFTYQVKATGQIYVADRPAVLGNEEEYRMLQELKDLLRAGVPGAESDVQGRRERSPRSSRIQSHS